MGFRVFAGGRNGLTSVDGSDSDRAAPPMHSGQENHVEGSQAGQRRSDPRAALRGFLMEKGGESAG